MSDNHRADNLSGPWLLSVCPECGCEGLGNGPCLHSTFENGTWTDIDHPVETVQVEVMPTEPVKEALRSIRLECVSGRDEMHAVDEAWRVLFGDTADAPWKAGVV